MTTWLSDVSADTPFSLENIPFGIISHGENGRRVAATRIGDHAIDLSALAAAGLLESVVDEQAKQRRVFEQPTLNAFAALPSGTRSAIRAEIQKLFSSNSEDRFDEALRKRVVHDIRDVEVHLPMQIPDFIDFSVYPAHGLGAGRAIFGPDSTLPPSFSRLPMAYNGRAGTVTMNEEIVRPQGQTRAFSAQREIETGHSRALDWEFEIGAFIAEPTSDGTYLTPESARSRIFGYVLLNDWSARDIQGFEMVPLGPFNGKSFATTISPWVVTPDALERFTTARPTSLDGVEAEIPDYLAEAPGAKTNYEVKCVTSLRLNSDQQNVHHVSTANFADAFWSFPQLIAYQTFNGARIQTGDLLGSGTISSTGENAQGCMLEKSQGGKVPVKIGNKERRWIEDGDQVIFEASAGESGKKVGFGALRGKILPAAQLRRV
ncbi:hypothetical protein JCM10908_003449 [Rhodotorula pacifica]|uniref:uncharacterized protein n=1 Tax=Rhodotorula pacifica TaxID=1495444 RepID=UPI003176F11C